MLALEGVVCSENQPKSENPLNLEIHRGTFHCLILDHEEEVRTLVQVIKGIAKPSRGRILKEGRDTTGWIHPDGIIAITDTDRFFFPTVRDEISFAVQTGLAKGCNVSSFLEEILEAARIKILMDRDPLHLKGPQQELLALTAALLMSPALLILLNPMEHGETDVRRRYLHLLELGSRVLGLALLQIVSSNTPPAPLIPSDPEESTPCFPFLSPAGIQ